MRLAALALLCGAAPLAGWTSTLPGEDAPGVVLETLDGGLERLEIVDLGLAAIANREAAFLRIEGLEAPAGPAPGSAARVVLLGGDRLTAEVRGGGGDLLELGLSGGAELVVLVDRLESLVFVDRITPQTRARLAAAGEGDLLYWLRPGGTLDRVPGTLLAFAADGLRLEGSFGERSFPWDEVAALYVEALGEPAPVAGAAAGLGLRPDASVVVDLVDGGRLHGRLRSLGAGGLRLEHAPGREVDLPLCAVAEVAADDGRARFLSDLEPAQVVEGSPFGDDLGLSWPYRRDLSVSGAPLRAGGRTWTRGLGVHAPSRIVYALDGGWKSLRAFAAIDDQVMLLSAHGSVVFRVRVDGEERWSSAIVRGGDAPIELPAIDLAGARELTLEVDMAEDHYVADRADWLRPLLVRLP